MNYESDAQIAARTAHEQAYRDHKAPRGPAYRPIRARLLLQVEKRPGVEVVCFIAEAADTLDDGTRLYRVADAHLLEMRVAAALTVEVRELLAVQRKHEDPTEGTR